MKTYFVYILASERNGTLYVGVTNDLVRRMDEHAQEDGQGFTSKYNVKSLIYFEQTESVGAAIAREKLSRTP